MKKVQSKNEVVVILPDIRSAHNVGSIFRCAECFGATRVILTGITPTPLDRFKRPQKEIAKTALGAEKNVPYTVSDIESSIKDLKQQGFIIIAIEQNSKSTNLNTINKKNFKHKKIVLIFGNEVDGVDKSILKKVDIILEIDMLGEKESLNVAITAGITLYHFTNML